MTQSIRQSGDGSFRAPPTMTPHRHQELEPLGDMTPPLPDDGDRAYVWLGTRPAVVTRHDQRGRELYNVHLPQGCHTYPRERLLQWWPAANTWDPPETVKDMVTDTVLDGKYDGEAEAAGYDSPLSYAMALVDSVGKATFEELDAEQAEVA